MDFHRMYLIKLGFDANTKFDLIAEAAIGALKVSSPKENEWFSPKINIFD
jgi:hypothetical protein